DPAGFVWGSGRCLSGRSRDDAVAGADADERIHFDLYERGHAGDGRERAGVLERHYCVRNHLQVASSGRSVGQKLLSTWLMLGASHLDLRAVTYLDPSAWTCRGRLPDLRLSFHFACGADGRMSGRRNLYTGIRHLIA